MLAIRLKRVGRKHQPAFRIVVAEKRSKRDGRITEDIGFYNPVYKNFNIKKDRFEYWFKVGAKPTSTVWNLLVSHKILNAPKIKIKTKSKSSNSEQNLEAKDINNQSAQTEDKTESKILSNEEKVNNVIEETSN